MITFAPEGEVTMEEADLPRLGERLEAWISDRRPDPTFGSGAVSAAGREGQVRHVLAVARLVVEGIAATAPEVSVKDRTKYDAVSSMLPNIIGFDDFSLAEYTFLLPGNKNPGVRLWLERGDEASRISVTAYEDVVQWRVTHEGRKISQVLLTLDVTDDETRASVPGSTDEPRRAPRLWQELLREALVAPVEIYR